MEKLDYTKIKDGDILLSHYIGNWFKYPLDTLITKRICAYTDSLYSHAAVIFREFVGAYCICPEIIGHVQCAPTIHTNNYTRLIVTEAVAKGLVINNFEKYLDEKRYRITIIRIMKKVETQCIASISDNQCLSPISLNNNPLTPFNKGDNTPLIPLKRGCTPPNPLPMGEGRVRVCCSKYITQDESDPKIGEINSELDSGCEALTDEMRLKMKENAFNIINSSKNYYDKKLLILIALAIRLLGKNGYENGMNYLRCHYDNFWICSEWVQYLYAQVGIKFTESNRLLTPEDFNKYEDKEIIFNNLLIT